MKKLMQKFFYFSSIPQKVLVLLYNTPTTKKTRCHLLFHLGNSAPYGLFHATLLELAFIKNPKKLSKKLLVIPTSSDLIMIVMVVVALDVLDAVKKKLKIFHTIWKYLGFEKNIVIDLKAKKTLLIKKLY